MNNFFAFIIVILFSGCSSIQQIDSAKKTEVELKNGEANFQMNVQAGHWQDYRIEFDSQEKQKFKMAMFRRNYDAKWAPTQIICVGAKSPSSEICIKVGAFTTSNKEQLALEMTLGDSDGKKYSEVISVVGNFPIGHAISVDITVERDEVEFNINGGINRRHRMDFLPEMIRIGCSSVECGFVFLNL